MTTFDHYRSLDGLRGVSIILVLCVHLHIISPTTSYVFAGGSLGVDVFFVISGFLITSILLNENAKNGHISLLNFYARRVLRLFPALISVVLFTCLVAVIVGSFSALGITPLRLASVVGYFANWVRAYEPPAVWFLAHCWSLAVEEQFYLIWPIILITLLKFTSRRTILTIVTSGIVLSGLLKIVLYLSGLATTRRIVYGSDTRADVVLMGCLIALLLHWDYLPKFLTNQETRGALTKSGTVILVTFFLIAGESFVPLYLGGFTVIAIAVAVVIIHIILTPESDLSRRLQYSPLVWIGKRSYGLYLWHWPIYEICRLLPKPLIVISAIGGSLIVAALSYRFIELPFLRLKSRYSGHGVAELSHVQPSALNT